MTTSQSTANTVLARWAQLFAQMDSEGLANLYAPEAVFYGATPELRSGREGVLRYFEALFPLSKAEVVFRDIVIQEVSPTAICLAATALFTLGERTALPFRLTQTLASLPDGWLIVSHHASPKAS